METSWNTNKERNRFRHVHAYLTREKELAMRMLELMNQICVTQRPKSLPGLRGRALAQSLQKFIIEKNRSPQFVELRAMVAEVFGTTDPLLPAEGDEIVQATFATPIDVEKAGLDAVKRYRAAAEVLFHHYPNPLNVARS
jgi:hypothetical protein